MKTAMQELITHLEMLKSRVDMVDINSLIDYANSSLEKEKEQIAKAFDERAKPYPYDGNENWEVLDCTGEFYYNHTYNKTNNL